MESLLKKFNCDACFPSWFSGRRQQGKQGWEFLEWKPPPFAGWGQIRDGERLPDYALRRPTASIRKSDQRFVSWIRHTGYCQYSDVKPANIRKA
jgi:hypothetical protein